MTYYRDLNGIIFYVRSEKHLEIKVNDLVYIKIKEHSEILITVKEKAMNTNLNVKNFTLVSCVRDFLPANFSPDSYSYYKISDETHQWIKDNLGLYD